MTKPQTIVLPCLKCGKENTLRFSEIKKHLQPAPDPTIVADCGCTLSAYEILKQFEDYVRRFAERRRRAPNSPE